MIRNCIDATHNGYLRLKDAFTVSNPAEPSRPLSRLRVGESAVVERIDAGESLARRLLEIGFFPGAAVKIVATMWPDDDPLAVHVGGATFALRRHEAEGVTVTTI
ncbi:MAG: ferrous iron transport protein A [Gammaproteobacteria bacterium]|nr:ferrous iron transport protein A [Gammaproteobacteria bacterium]